MFARLFLATVCLLVSGVCTAQPSEFSFVLIEAEADFSRINKETSSVSVTNKLALEDKHLGGLAAATNLRYLTISNSKLSVAGVRRLGDLKSLTDLEFCGEFKDVAILDALSACKSVTHLTVDGLNGVPLDWVAGLEKLPALTDLTIKGTRTGVGKFPEVIGRLQALSRLTISADCKFPDSGWTGLERHPALSSITFRHCAPSAGLILALGTLPKLVDLFLAVDPFGVGDAILDDKLLALLAVCTKLQKLDCQHAQITGKTFGALKACAELATISIWNCGLLTDLMFEQINEFPKLANLQLNGCPRISDACVSLLAESPSLKTLSLTNTPGITMRTVGYLEMASSIKVTFDAGVGSRHPRKGMAPLYNYKKLSNWVVESQLATLDADIDALNVDGPITLAGLTSLLAQRRLVWIKFSGATDDHLAQLSTHAGLLGCCFYNSPLVTDKGIKAIAANKSLRELIAECSASVSDKSIEAFKRHPSMASLMLTPKKSDGTKELASSLTDAGMAALTSIPQLRRVSLTLSDSVTDTGIDSLAKVKKLEHVRLYSGPKLTDKSAKTMAGIKGLLHAVFQRIPEFGGDAVRAFNGHKTICELAFYDCDNIPREAGKAYFIDNPGVVIRGGKPRDPLGRE